MLSVGMNCAGSEFDCVLEFKKLMKHSVRLFLEMTTLCKALCNNCTEKSNTDQRRVVLLQLYCYLPRYQRGSRSLAVNLSQSAASGEVLEVKPDLGSASPEEDYDIPEEVENVIGMCSPHSISIRELISKSSKNRHTVSILSYTPAFKRLESLSMLVDYFMYSNNTFF